MRLKKYLNTYMYKDIADIYRCCECVDGAVDDYEEAAVYTDIPCKLSQYGKDQVLNITDMAPEVQENLRMTCDSSYEIQPNDYVVVKHLGQKFGLSASRAFKYPTHQEVSLVRLANKRDTER